MEVMANGDILVSSDYSLARYTTNGALLATVPQRIADPSGPTASFNDSSDVLLTNVRGIECDAATDTTFVRMLGYLGGMNYKMLALVGFTPVLKGIQTFTYGTDMHVTDDGRLLVGSWTQPPGIFATFDLPFIGSGFLWEMRR